MPENGTANRFRTALHGFHRDDVVTYIERTTVAHENEVRQLQKLNDQLRAQLGEANAALEQARKTAVDPEELAAANERIRELTDANAGLNGQLQELEAEAAELRVHLAEKEEELRQKEAAAAAAEATPTPEAAPAQPAAPAVPQELDAPLTPIAEVVPAARPEKAYAELELAAYRRAEMTERLARERAADVYRQVQSVFDNANSRFDNGRSDLEQVTKTLQSDVNSMLALLANIRSIYNDTELSFGAVSEKNRQLLDAEE